MLALAALNTGLNVMADMVDVRNAKKYVEASLKVMTAKESPCKAFSLARGAFQKTLERVERQAVKAGGGEAAAQSKVEAPAPPLFTICK